MDCGKKTHNPIQSDGCCLEMRERGVVGALSIFKYSCVVELYHRMRYIYTTYRQYYGRGPLNRSQKHETVNCLPLCKGLPDLYVVSFARKPNKGYKVPLK